MLVDAVRRRGGGGARGMKINLPIRETVGAAFWRSVRSGSSKPKITMRALAFFPSGASGSGCQTSTHRMRIFLSSGTLTPLGSFSNTISVTYCLTSRAFAVLNLSRSAGLRYLSLTSILSFRS